MLAKRRVSKPLIVIVPADEFRRRLRTLRPDSPKRWATLADIVRGYLAAVRSHLGPELTTSELLSRVDHPEIAQILRQGDLEKFSPWGAAPADFEALAS